MSKGTWRNNIPVWGSHVVAFGPDAAEEIQLWCERKETDENAVLDLSQWLKEPLTPYQDNELFILGVVGENLKF